VIGVTAVAGVGAYSMAGTRRRAGELLRDIQALKLGEARPLDVERLMEKYGGRVDRITGPTYPEADFFYFIMPVQNGILEQYLLARWKIVHLITTRKLFGHSGCCNLQGWRGLGAYVRIKDGAVTGVHVYLHVRKRSGFVVIANVNVLPAIPAAYQVGDDSYHVSSYHLTAPGGGKGIQAILTPRATAAERERAFDLNLRCLTTLNGCTEFSEIVPVVWQDHQAYLRSFDPK
jgi:hypothetical protein